MTPSNISNITSLNKLDDKIKTQLKDSPLNYPLRSLMTVARIKDAKKQMIAFSALKNRTEKALKQESKNTLGKTEEEKNIQLFQQATRNLKKIGKLDKRIFNNLPIEAEDLSKVIATALSALFSADFNALKLDKLKSVISDCYVKISEEATSTVE